MTFKPPLGSVAALFFSSVEPVMSHAETQNPHSTALGLHVQEKQENKSFEEYCPMAQSSVVSARGSQAVARPEWGSSHGSALEKDLIPLSLCQPI